MGGGDSANQGLAHARNACGAIASRAYIDDYPLTKEAVVVSHDVLAVKGSEDARLVDGLLLLQMGRKWVQGGGGNGLQGKALSGESESERGCSKRGGARPARAASWSAEGIPRAPLPAAPGGINNGKAPATSRTTHLSLVHALQVDLLHRKHAAVLCEPGRACVRGGRGWKGRRGARRRRRGEKVEAASRNDLGDARGTEGRAMQGKAAASLRRTKNAPPPF